MSLASRNAVEALHHLKLELSRESSVEAVESPTSTNEPHFPAFMRRNFSETAMLHYDKYDYHTRQNKMSESCMTEEEFGRRKLRCFSESDEMPVGSTLNPPLNARRKSISHGDLGRMNIRKEPQKVQGGQDGGGLFSRMTSWFKF